MTANQNITYPCTLADLELFANAAAELDSAKMLATPDDRLRMQAMVCRMHEAVERIAGQDAAMVYPPEQQEDAA